MAKVLKSLSVEVYKLAESITGAWLGPVEKLEKKEEQIMNDTVRMMRARMLAWLRAQSNPQWKDQGDLRNIVDDYMLNLANRCAQFRNCRLSFDQQDALFFELTKLQILPTERFGIVLGLAYYWRWKNKQVDQIARLR
jgi:hypothetical protein